ncbi:MAG: hypothetical protein ACFE88_06930 [Candidatus Hermodarchaeota archaeon]
MSLFSIAKKVNKELYLESLLQTKGIYQLKILERYKKQQRILKIKVLISKIIYALVFGFLPIIPSLVYSNIVDNLLDLNVSVERVILIGGVILTLYFILQFLNFFLMGLLESSMILSGSVFRWFETLPISRDKLHKLVALTIFRTFDIPIVVLILAFPITMIALTQSIIIFLVSLGISFLNFILSFDIIIIFGEKLSRFLAFNKSSSKKGFIIRLFHNLSYIIVVLGGIYMIQGILFSFDKVIQLIITIEDISIITTFLSILPYPFNPSYLISFIIVNKGIPIFLLISIFIGLGFFISLTWLIHLRALKSLERITYSNLQEIKERNRIKSFKDENQINIKTRSPILAYLHKDLSIATRDLKMLLSMIIPIIFSCIFTFSFGLINMGEKTVIERDFLLNLISILLINPVISSMLVYGILNIEISGESVLASLPINGRDQAKAKLILLIFLQTLAVFAPIFLYLFTPKFIILLLTAITSLFFCWMFIILIFDLRIIFFGKFKHHYVIEEINQGNRLLKWILIIGIQYSISLGIIFFFRLFYTYTEFLNLVIFLLSISITGLLCAILLFNKILPIIPESKLYLKKEPKYMKGTKRTYLLRHPWISIFLLIILFFGTIYQLYYLNRTLFPVPYYYYHFYGIYQIEFVIKNLILLILYNLSSIALLIIIIPKVLNLPHGQQSIRKYLISIKARWPKSLTKYFIWGVSILIFLIFLISLANLIIDAEIYFEFWDILTLSLFFSNIIWQEVFFHGIILTILLENLNKRKAIVIDTLLLIFYYIVFLNFVIFPLILFSYFYLIFILVFFSFPCFLFTYLSFKANSILPSIVAQFILCLIGMPLFTLYYYFIFL